MIGESGNEIGIKAIESVSEMGFGIGGKNPQYKRYVVEEAHKLVRNSEELQDGEAILDTIDRKEGENNAQFLREIFLERVKELPEDQVNAFFSLKWWQEGNDAKTIDQAWADLWSTAEISEKQHEVRQQKEKFEAENPMFAEFVLQQGLDIANPLQAKIGTRLVDLGVSTVTERTVDWRLNEAGKTVEVETSLNTLYKTESVAAKYFQTRDRVSDTRFSWIIPLKDDELARFKDGFGDINLRKQLAYGISNAGEVIGMGGGFGTTKEVWKSVADKFLRGGWEKFDEPNYQGRTVGINISTKGAEGTALEKDGKVISGFMDVAAVQIADTLGSLGIVGRDQHIPVLWIGHSMGGEEALWLPLYAKKNWALWTLPITPVTGSEKELLTLLHGISGLGTKLLVNSGPLFPLVAAVAKHGGIAERLVAPKVVQLSYEGSQDTLQRQEIGRLDDTVGHHVEVITDPTEQQYMQGVLYALEHSKRLTSEMLKVLAVWYGDKYVKILTAGRDACLDTAMMEAALTEGAMGSKIEQIKEAPHYLQMTQLGIETILVQIREWRKRADKWVEERTS